MKRKKEVKQHLADGFPGVGKLHTILRGAWPGQLSLAVSF